MDTDEPKERIFFGSIENIEKQRMEQGSQTTPSPMEGIDRLVLPTELLPISEKTQDSIDRQKKILEEIEMKKKMKDIAVPTNDDMVKQRLNELNEPAILFGEGKPERRERLRRIMAERGITQPMPTGQRTKQQQQQQLQQEEGEAILMVGKPELKELRLYLLERSLLNARRRLKEQRQQRAALEANWEQTDKNFENMGAKFSKFSEVASQVGDTRPLSHVAFSPTGTYVATSAWTGVCKIWDAKTTKLRSVMKGHTERAQHITWNPNAGGPTTLNLVSSGADNKILFWPLENPSGDTAELKPMKILEGHWDRVNNTVFHPSGRWLGSTSFDKTWCLWDVETGLEILTQGGNSRAVYALAFHCDGALVATAGLDGVGRVWDLRGGKPIWNFRGHVKQILGIDWHCDGYHMATGSDDRTVRIWDLRKKKTQYVIPAHNHLISTVKYQPKYGNFLVTASFDNTVKIWSTKDFSVCRVLTGHEANISAADFSPEVMDPTDPVEFQVPKRFATSSHDRTWKLWEYDRLVDLGL